MPVSVLLHLAPSKLVHYEMQAAIVEVAAGRDSERAERCWGPHLWARWRVSAMVGAMNATKRVYGAVLLCRSCVIPCKDARRHHSRSPAPRICRGEAQHRPGHGR